MMTSRERVQAALAHRQPDRIPVDLGGAVVTGIHASALYRLRQALGLPVTAVKVYEPMMMLGLVEDDLRWGGGVDPQKTLPFGTPEQVAEETRRNVAVLSQGGGFVCAAVHNIQGPTPAENILAFFRSVNAGRRQEPAVFRGGVGMGNGP